jgi:hypothetical protein
MLRISAWQVVFAEAYDDRLETNMEANINMYSHYTFLPKPFNVSSLFIFRNLVELLHFLMKLGESELLVLHLM